MKTVLNFFSEQIYIFLKTFTNATILLAGIGAIIGLW